MEIFKFLAIPIALFSFAFMDGFIRNGLGIEGKMPLSIRFYHVIFSIALVSVVLFVINETGRIFI
jgi:hypothetical protein